MAGPGRYPVEGKFDDLLPEKKANPHEEKRELRKKTPPEPT